MKLLLYCTKAMPYLIQGLAKPMHTLDVNNPFNFNWKLVNKGFSNDRVNGKIVAECDYEVEDLRTVDDDPLGTYWYETKTLSENEVLEKSCLTSDELYEYLGEYNEGHAIHIKNLHIFDKSRELSEYYSDIQRCVGVKAPVIKQAPQNMRYAFDYYGNPFVVISISPEWLCKILNGEKTIEVRKKVLKGMLK